MLRSLHTGKDVFVIFDVGKTHKKMLLFDTSYKVVREESSEFPTIKDEDGFEADDIQLISTWLKLKITELSSDPSWNILGINFTAYGATLVNLDETGNPVTVLYNYLKPIEPHIEEEFYSLFGGRDKFATETSSPPLGMLNAGFQLYWLKYHKPDLFKTIHRSLFLPQYLSFLVTGRQCSELTSIGCHTGLWNFRQNDFHSWVYDEWMQTVLAPISQDPIAGYIEIRGKMVPVGVGLHDSSASLLPYMYMSEDSFIVLSTGTWAITLNPFNHSPLTSEELANDVLAYMLPNGEPVKAARLLMGMEHDIQVSRIAKEYHLHAHFYESMKWDESVYNENTSVPDNFIHSSQGIWNMEVYGNGMRAYYALLRGLLNMLVRAFNMVDMSSITTVFVDGGFARNPVFMQMLKKKLPRKRFITSKVPEATAFGSLIYLRQPERIDLSDENTILL
jgi:sugar (pentulose or hexulose) kinase